MLRLLAVNSIVNNDAATLADALACGASPAQVVSSTDGTLLHFAVRRGAAACVRQLMRFGANAFQLDGAKNTALFYVTGRAFRGNSQSRVDGARHATRTDGTRRDATRRD